LSLACLDSNLYIGSVTVVLFESDAVFMKPGCSTSGLSSGRN